jgi:hypothetical protein
MRETSSRTNIADSLHETSITNVRFLMMTKANQVAATKVFQGKSESDNVRKEISQSSEKVYGKRL